MAYYFALVCFYFQLAILLHQFYICALICHSAKSYQWLDMLVHHVLSYEIHVRYRLLNCLFWKICTCESLSYKQKLCKKRLERRPEKWSKKTPINTLRASQGHNRCSWPRKNYYQCSITILKPRLSFILKFC